jgi:hypothetical protein
MQGRKAKLYSVTAIGTLECDLADSLQDGGAILPLPTTRHEYGHLLFLN